MQYIPRGFFDNARYSGETSDSRAFAQATHEISCFKY